MSDAAATSADLAAIRAAFGIEVQYTHCRSGWSMPVVAVEAEVAAATFMGPGDTLREMTFEIGIADLPDEPDKGDLIAHPDGTDWNVTEHALRRDIEAWVVTVEKAA